MCGGRAKGGCKNSAQPADGGHEAHGSASAEIHYRNPDCTVPTTRCPHTRPSVEGLLCLLGKARWVCERAVLRALAWPVVASASPTRAQQQMALRRPWTSSLRGLSDTKGPVLPLGVGLSFLHIPTACPPPPPALATDLYPLSKLTQKASRAWGES